MFQSPVAQLPSMAQFSNAILHALVGGAARKLAPDLLVRRQARLERLAAHAAGEAGDGAGAEEMRVVDQRLPAGQRLPVELVVLQRIAEHAERVDRHVGVADRLAEFAREPRQILVHRLPEERLDALEAVPDDGSDISGRVGRVGPDHGSDANVEELSHGRLVQITMSTRWPCSALSMAPRTMASERMLSLPAVSG